MVSWNSPFSDIDHPMLKHGIHCSTPSVLFETKSWLDKMQCFDFVDPEIGHFGQAADEANIPFGYLHVISDNVKYPFNEDLSNERTKSVLQKREHILESIREIVNRIL